MTGHECTYMGRNNASIAYGSRAFGRGRKNEGFWKLQFVGDEARFAKSGKRCASVEVRFYREKKGSEFFFFFS